MDPDDGRFNTRPSGRLLGLAALVGLVLCSCGGEPSAERSTHPHLAEVLDTAKLEEGSREFLPVDSTFIIIEDLTSDGEADSLELRVLGPRMEDPFSWKVRIWVRGELVFEHEAVDTHWDQFFGQPGFAYTSRSREEDKAQYYLDELPKRIVDRAQFEATSPVFDPHSPAGVSRTLMRELRERGLADEHVVRGIIEDVEGRMRAGTVLLSIPQSPGLSEFPRIYVEEVGEFIPVFVW